MKNAIAITLLIFALAPFASAQGQEIAQLNGGWHGSWSFSSNSGNLTLSLSPDPAKTTLSATNVPGFGTAPVPAEVLSFKKKKFEFRAIGADSSVVEASLKVSSDRSKMSGWATHMGQAVWFELRKTGG